MLGYSKSVANTMAYLKERGLTLNTYEFDSLTNYSFCNLSQIMFYFWIFHLIFEIVANVIYMKIYNVLININT